LQQSSDTTFRVYDWGRPASAGRKLHVEESVEVVDPRRGADVHPAPALGGTAAAAAFDCDYFGLDVVRVGDATFEGDTGGRSFHLLTAAEGEVDISCGGVESIRLARFETALVAGDAGVYELRARVGPAKVLRAIVPPRRPVKSEPAASV
jgi:mannose-6-phosphate isomerase